MVAVVIAASIATALAYSGMVLFGLEVAGMAPAEAYALAGFLEVSLVAVALMARNAALEARPYGVLLTLTWILSGTSGLFAALHEVAIASASTPYMVVFRFIPPLVAALMWHLALVGERHLVTGDTLDERRREHRVHGYVTALEQWRDARLDNMGTRRGTHKVRSAHQAQRVARDRALKLLTVEDFERRMQVWVERLEAAERHGNRLDLIGASSVKRGMSPGVVETMSPAEMTAPIDIDQAHEASVTEHFSDVSVEALLREAEQEHSVDASHQTDHVAESAVTDQTVRTSDTAGTSNSVEDAADDTVEDSIDSPHYDERLPETGHTRRVEIFDLMDRPDWATRGAASTQDRESAGQQSDDAPVASADVPDTDRDQRIVALARDGVPHKDIAEAVDASRSTVGRVVRRYGVRAAVNASESELARV